MKTRLILILAILLSTVEVGQCERIKDIVDIQGIRSNPLRGTGLIIGLAGTGDTSWGLLPAKALELMLTFPPLEMRKAFKVECSCRHH
jgi:flagellar basal body P-ring protein FlgI